MKQRAIVIGAGIVGLATARALAVKGYAVTVIDRSLKAAGASVRNFGMLWPVGQPEGTLYERALRTKEVWKDIADSAGIWYEECGSLHVAHRADEWIVLQELYEAFKTSGRPVELIDRSSIGKKFPSVIQKNLLGGLYSATETIVDPRMAIAAIPAYLEEYFDVQFIWGKHVSHLANGKVWMGIETAEADIVCICSGADFESLYPEIFSSHAITKCKLQMLRFAPEDSLFRMNVAVCGGLSLVHYQSFQQAGSLTLLKERYMQEMPEYLKHGIHVMVAQNKQGEFTVGDSHEYGLQFDPFDNADINQLIINYLKTFAVCNDWKPVQSWHGIYAKMQEGSTELFVNPDPGVFIINAVGGAGMTLSFGLAEEITQNL